MVTTAVRLAVTLLIAWLVAALAFAVTSWVLSGMDVSGGFWGYLWVSALFGIVNATVGTLLRIVTLPLKWLTLGLISVIVNAALLELTDALSDHLSIDDFFWTAIWAAILLSLVTLVLGFVLALAATPARQG
jgi:putative membrane protein